MTLEGIISHINGIVWGPVVLVFLVGTGMYLSCCFGIIQPFFHDFTS